MLARKVPILLVVAALVSGVAPGQSLVMNEVLSREPGLDRTEFVELLGPPGQSLEGVALLRVDGRSDTSGTLELVLDLSEYAVPSDGLLLIGREELEGFDIRVTKTNWLGNGTTTLYLVSTNDLGPLLDLRGQNVDADGNGETPIPQLVSILDIIALADENWLSGQDRVFDGAEVRGPEEGLTPAGIFRSQDNGNWCTEYLAFESFEDTQYLLPTPGLPNPSCPWGQRTLRGRNHTRPFTVDEYGSALALTDDGTTLLVGSPRDRFHGSGTGAVHVLDLLTGQRTSVLSTWPSPSWGRFGSNVATSGCLAWIDSPNEDAFYIFDWTTGRELARISLSIPQSYPVLAVDGDFAVVGTLFPTDPLGFAAVFDSRTGTWLHELSPPANPWTRFGYSVAINQGQVLVGAPHYKLGATMAGAAFLFDAATGTHLETFVPDPPRPNGQFGSAVALDEQDIVISAPGGSRGHIYSFSRATNNFEQVLISPFPQQGTAQRGTALALHQRKVLAGVSSEEVGAVLFDLETPGEWKTISPVGEWGRTADSVALSDTACYLGAQFAPYIDGSEGAVIEIELTSGTPFCKAEPSSLGAPAAISSQGSASLAAENLSLHAVPVPPDQPGFFFYGSEAVQLPFGPGIRCVSGSTARLPVEHSTPGGALTHVLDSSRPPTGFVQIEPYSTWYFQAWFRDPHGSGSQLSNGVEVTFRP